jgi:actin-like ATPase involved in cell morphogenesis
MIRAIKVLLAVPLFIAAVEIAAVNAQPNSSLVKAVQLIGLPGVKENVKGTLSVENGSLHFVQGKRTSDISASSMQDVIAGSDNQKAVGKTLGTISMVAPYGGGRVLSLFRKQIDTLTVEYRDADGAFHGAIFTMPPGAADTIKQELIAQGAHTAAAAEQAGTVQSSQGTLHKEQQQ